MGSVTMSMIVYRGRNRGTQFMGIPNMHFIVPICCRARIRIYVYVHHMRIQCLVIE